MQCHANIARHICGDDFFLQGSRPSRRVDGHKSPSTKEPKKKDNFCPNSGAGASPSLSGCFAATSRQADSRGALCFRLLPLGSEQRGQAQQKEMADAELVQQALVQIGCGRSPGLPARRLLRGERRLLKSSWLAQGFGRFS